MGNVVHFFGLVDREEERIASSMEKRLVQYKNLLQVLIKVLTIAASGLDVQQKQGAGLLQFHQRHCLFTFGEIFVGWRRYSFHKIEKPRVPVEPQGVDLDQRTLDTGCQ